MKDIQVLFEEDKQLLEAIKQHDKKQFEVLYKKYYKQLFAVAYRYVGQQEVAEEIVHDVFIIIWSKIDSLVIKQSVKSYLFRSVINSALNVIKKEKMDAQKQLAYMTIQDNEASDEVIHETEEALLSSLEQALELLPAKCKQVMYLSRFGKLKQHEIAAQLDISIKTVKNHLTYGFQKLREHLEKHKQVVVSLLILLTILTP
ncbi:RNA polymerase sigma factor [Pedobacter metabolipauper]|uniref:RNA polymerase sigma-70 factor (ECF subfamily) n=1 Tax=Pedobacter metabolipauper TaxID=425513 RepID=A0A4R6SV89_9SPHI|nr:RNA polymerase sigma-70 factor [Pedobacter metabolipauper]TDQ09246.1 RNA polymerase sigma-70 factor (ECF subfamily) [Pedobacter metabolipauper]